MFIYISWLVWNNPKFVCLAHLEKHDPELKKIFQKVFCCMMKDKKWRQISNFEMKGGGIFFRVKVIFCGVIFKVIKHLIFVWIQDVKKLSPSREQFISTQYFYSPRYFTNRSHGFIIFKKKQVTLGIKSLFAPEKTLKTMDDEQ